MISSVFHEDSVDKVEGEEEEDETHYSVDGKEGKYLLPLLRRELAHLLVDGLLELHWSLERGFGLYSTGGVEAHSVLFVDHPILRCSRESLSKDVRRMCSTTSSASSFTCPTLVNFFHPRSKSHPSVETYRLRHYADPSTSPSSTNTPAAAVKMAMLHARIVLNGFSAGDQIVVNALSTFINHSCDPNSMPQATESWPDETRFVAVRDITPGEEITIPYQLLRDAPDAESHRNLLWRKYRIPCNCPNDTENINAHFLPKLL